MTLNFLGKHENALATIRWFMDGENPRCDSDYFWLILILLDKMIVLPKFERKSSKEIVMTK